MPYPAGTIWGHAHGYNHGGSESLAWYYTQLSKSLIIWWCFSFLLLSNILLTSPFFCFSDIRNHPMLVHCNGGKVRSTPFILSTYFILFFFHNVASPLTHVSSQCSIGLVVSSRVSGSCKIGACPPCSTNTCSMLLARPGCQTWSSSKVLMFRMWGNLSLASSIATTDVDPKPWGLCIEWDKI